MNTKIHTVYKNKAGDKVPSVTTVLGLLAKPALIHWAWTCGKDGLDYRKVKDAAAGIGILTHYLIMCELKEIKPDLSEYSPTTIDKAETGFLNWLEWHKGKNIETIQSEIPLISIQGFGGTIDWVARQDKDLWLIDFKTSKQLYDEHIFQVAAYKMLWEENYANQPLSQIHILRIDKESGGFEDRLINEHQLTIGGQIFLDCLAIYNKQKLMGKGV